MAKAGFSNLGFNEMCGASMSSDQVVCGKDLQHTIRVTDDVTQNLSATVDDMRLSGADINPNVTRADADVVLDDVSKPVSHNDRVSVWDRITYPLVNDPKVNSTTDGSKKTFASIVGGVPKPELEFFPMEKDAKLRVQIPKALTQGMADTYKSVLYGYFLGPRIPFPVVLRAVQNAWGKFGFKDAMMNEHGTFFFQFNTEGGCSQVIESSPLMIKGVPLFVYPWDPFKGLHKPEHNTCPLWIKFYNIPLVAFNREGISRIASAVGVPLRMDACTAATCDKAWGRTNFAKVLVNVWATGKLAREVEVAIPHLLDDGEEIVKVVLEYDWEPTQCSCCKVFGHKDALCPKAVIPQVVSEPKQHKEGDGFQYPRRKQWRPKHVPTKTGGMGETSSVKKGVGLDNTDTLEGVGTIKKMVGEPTVTLDTSQSPIGNNNVVNKGTPTAEGGFCTLNAGRTPGVKVSEMGMSNPVISTDGGKKGGMTGGVEVDMGKKNSPNLLKSVVSTFKQLERAKRGTPLPVVTSNSFEVISSDASSEDFEVERPDEATRGNQ